MDSKQSVDKRVVICRLVLVLMLLGSILSLIFYRALSLTYLERSFLLSQGNARSVRDLKITAFRGMLFDRNHHALAVSTPVMAAWISPHDFELTHPALPVLAKLLKTNVYALKNKIASSSARHFLYLKRELSPETAEKIKSLNLPGLTLQKEYKRFYPLAEVLAPVIGFTNVDDRGIEGLELAFEHYLDGKDGLRRVIKDRLGHIIDEVSILKSPRQGEHIDLSLDKRIQYVAYRYLKETVQKFAAHSGSVVVMNVKNGEILAMANYPSFNPNTRMTTRDGSYRNRASTDLFEPGSVMKAFSVASALDSGLFSPDTLIDTAPSMLKVDGNIIRDERNHGLLSVKQILKRSSNVGVTKMVLASPASQLENLLRRVGFGRATGSGFPGESMGMLEDKTYASPFVLATLGFGYGLSVTTLQLAQAYAVFGNGGYLMPATFLLTDHKKLNAQQVISSKIADQILDMLEAVVEQDGTGRFAQVNGYRIAGKTGTSRIATKSGYDKNKHIASFVGMGPVSKPALVIAVVVREPTKITYYGGRVAAPLFSKIMGESLRILGLSPDKPLT